MKKIFFALRNGIFLVVTFFLSCGSESDMPKNDKEPQGIIFASRSRSNPDTFDVYRCLYCREEESLDRKLEKFQGRFHDSAVRTKDKKLKRILQQKEDSLRVRIGQIRAVMLHFEY